MTEDRKQRTEDRGQTAKEAPYRAKPPFALHLLSGALHLIPYTFYLLPRLFYRKPTPVIQYRASDGKSLSTSYQLPDTSYQMPDTSGQRPVTSDQQPAAGFTLVEILLAFLILGIVMTTILASFNAVFSTTDTLNNSSRYYEMAKNCLNRMTLDLEALYVGQPPLYKKPEFDDPPDPYRIVGSTEDSGGTSFAAIRFTSSAHIPLAKSNRDGIAEIVYYVQTKNDGQMALNRADHLYPYPEFEEKGGDPVLCNNLKSLVFKYYDAEGSEFDEWNSDADEYGYATPAAISIQLEIGNETTSYDFETTVRLAVRRGKLE